MLCVWKLPPLVGTWRGVWGWAMGGGFFWGAGAPPRPCPYKFYETIECFSGGDELGMTWIGIILEVDEVGGDEIAEGFAVTDVVSDDMTQELSAEGL